MVSQKCEICGNTLLSAFAMTKVCAWCIKNEKQKMKQIPKPGYGFRNRR